jgi:hypothetical protein
MDPTGPPATTGILIIPNSVTKGTYMYDPKITYILFSTKIPIKKANLLKNEDVSR